MRREDFLDFMERKCVFCSRDKSTREKDFENGCPFIREVLKNGTFRTPHGIYIKDGEYVCEHFED